MADALEVREGTKVQGSEESLSYSVVTTPWGSSPTAVSVTAWDETHNKDVTTTVFPTNSPTVSTDTITLSPLKSLNQGHLYRIKVKFTATGQIWECYFRVRCEI